MIFVKDRQKKLVRMVKIEHLFYQNPQGQTLEELAEKCMVSKKTITRDIADLEESIYLPVYQERNFDKKTRYKIDPHNFVPLTAINMQEAMCIFMALRLMSRHAYRYDPNIASTFEKLNSTVPSPLRDQIQKTLEWMMHLPEDKRSGDIRNTIAQAMVNSQRVKITYKGKEKSNRTIQPYCIEPAATGHASYVIAFCQKAKDVRTFKIERIESAVLLKQKYAIPLDFDASKYFSTGWGIESEGQVKTIKMRLKPGAAKNSREVIWHPSQKIDMHKDGSALMTVKVVDTSEFYNWVLGWGDEIEVLLPVDVRQNVIDMATKTIKVYKNLFYFNN